MMDENKRVHLLADHIALAIDMWRNANHNITVMEVLKALEIIRHTLTEALISAENLRPPTSS